MYLITLHHYSEDEHQIYSFSFLCVQGALWNCLQHAWDRQNNPILRAGKASGAPTETTTPASKNCSSFRCLPDAPEDLGDLPEQMRAFIRSMHRRDYPLLINRPETCGTDNSSLGLGSGTPMLLMAIKSQVGQWCKVTK